MRRTISFLLVSVFLTSGISLVSAQRRSPQRPEAAASESSAAKTAKPNQGDAKTKFAMVRAYTQGSGVWVHWQMESEFNNYGFYVYRVNHDGETRISEMELGSGNVPTLGKHYAFFDESGTTADTYFVEALDAKRIVKSRVTSVSLVDELPNVGDGTLFQHIPRVEERVRPTSSALSLPEELSSEVAASALSANLTRHVEVISQPGVKIKIRTSGLIRVTSAQLSAAGFNVNGDSSKWQLYLEGNELPIIIGPNAAYIEFVGKAIDTVESDVRTYYLIEGTTTGKRAIVIDGLPGRGRAVSVGYNQNFTLKERLYYLMDLLNGDGENYFGRLVGSAGTNLELNLTAVDLTPGDRTLSIGFQGYSIASHSIEIRLNNNLLPSTVTGSGLSRFTKTYTIPSSYLVEGLNTLNMKSVLTNDTSLLDFVSIDYTRGYRAVNNSLEFYTESKRDTILSGFTTPNVRLFEVTYEGQLLEYVNNTIVQTGNTYGPLIPASRSRVYYATAATPSTPVSVQPNDPALLGLPSNAATMVIIAHASLMPEARAWRDYRQSPEGGNVSTIVVDVEEIFDEFNYGVSSSLSIRSFLNYAKNNWQTPPGYVLLIGDATYDPKNYENLGGYWNMVPSRMVNTFFEETGSDEALADFNNDGLAEIPIGRIASRTGPGVTNVLNKTKKFEAAVAANPNIASKTALFAYDQNDSYQFDSMSNDVMAKLPLSMPKITVERGKPNVKTAENTVIDAFNNGAFVANYTGHGSSSAWRDADFLDTSDFSLFSGSTNTPTLVTALTCLNAYFVSAGPTDTFAEGITKVPNGGAVAIWASTGRTTPDVQKVMALRFYEQLAVGNITRLGDLVKDAKSQLIAGRDVRLSWALIGDPMLKVR